MKFDLNKFSLEHLHNIKKLKLERPIVIFDTETTGLNIKFAEIVELMAIKLHPDGKHEEFYSLFNPIGNIDKAASDVHGYTKIRLKDQPRIKDRIDEIYDFFIGCDLLAYNGIRFDIPLMQEIFKKHNKNYNPNNYNIIDPLKIIQKRSSPGNKKISNKLVDVYERFFKEELKNAHAATADIIAAFRVFDKQIELFNLPLSIKEISNPEGQMILAENKISVSATKTPIPVNKKQNNDSDEFIIIDEHGRLFKGKQKEKSYYFNKGKHNNEKVGPKHLGYLKWVAEASSFEEETKKTAKLLIKRITS